MFCKSALFSTVYKQFKLKCEILKRCVPKCFKDHNTRGAYNLMPSGRVFYSVAAAVSINCLPSFTVLLLLGTNDVVFAHRICL